MAKGKEMEVKQEQQVAVMGSTARGFENFRQEDLIIPRLRLLQGISEAVTSGEGEMGQFQDSLSGEILGESIEVVLLGLKNGAVYFKKGEGLRCKSEDGIANKDGVKCTDCPYNEYYGERWAKDEDPPDCSATKEFVCVTRATLNGSEQRPIVVSFLKTSYKQGRKLASIARLSGKDIFAGAYVIKSQIIKNTKGTFAVMDVKRNGWLTPEEFKAAEAWYRTIVSSNVVVHEAEASEHVEEDVI